MNNKKGLGLLGAAIGLVVVLVGVILSISATNVKNSNVMTEDDIKVDSSLAYGKTFRYNGLLIAINKPFETTNKENQKEILVGGVAVKRESGDGQTDKIEIKGVTKNHKVVSTIKTKPLEDMKIKEDGTLKVTKYKNLGELLKKPIKKGETVHGIITFNKTDLDHLVVLDEGSPMINIK